MSTVFLYANILSFLFNQDRCIRSAACLIHVLGVWLVFHQSFDRSAYPMVLTLEGYSEHVAHSSREWFVRRIKIRFLTALDQIKCLKQIKNRVFLMCAPILELASDISTMVWPLAIFHSIYFTALCLTFGIFPPRLQSF